MIESASLYTSRGEVDVDADEVAVIGAAAVRRSGDAVTLVSWGAATVRTLAAAAMLADDGIEAAVIDARSLGPIDHAAIRASVRRTGHLVVVQDATGPCSVGSEIIATAALAALPAVRACAIDARPAGQLLPIARSNRSAGKKTGLSTCGEGMTSPDPGPGGLVDVVVPKWGMTMDSAVLTEWLKGEGDVVAVDDPLAELETDKAVNELVSQVSGILAELLVEAGAEVEPGQAIARIRPDSLQA